MGKPDVEIKRTLETTDAQGYAQDTYRICTGWIYELRRALVPLRLPTAHMQRIAVPRPRLDEACEEMEADRIKKEVEKTQEEERQVRMSKRSGMQRPEPEDNTVQAKTRYGLEELNITPDGTWIEKRVHMEILNSAIQRSWRHALVEVLVPPPAWAV
jgi:hypothetical protein